MPLLVFFLFFFFVIVSVRVCVGITDSKFQLERLKLSCAIDPQWFRLHAEKERERETIGCIWRAKVQDEFRQGHTKWWYYFFFCFVLLFNEK